MISLVMSATGNIHSVGGLLASTLIFDAFQVAMNGMRLLKTRILFFFFFFFFFRHFSLTIIFKKAPETTTHSTVCSN